MRRRPGHTLRRHWRLLAAAVAWLMLAATWVYAATSEPTDFIGTVLGLARDDGLDLSKPVPANVPTLLNVDNHVSELLADPTTQEAVNKVIKKQIERIPFLAGLDLKLKTFAEEGGDTSLGVEYSYDKAVAHREITAISETDRNHYLEIDFNGSARGNVAFDHHTNPADFLDTNTSLGVYWSSGGTRRRYTPEEQKRYRVLEREIAQLQTEAELWSSPKTYEFLSLARSTLSNQVAVDLRSKFGLESNQDFSKKQLVYGGNVGFVLTGWEKFDARTWDATSQLAKFNVIDYPFAAIRWLSGFDAGFAPRGVSFPAAHLGLALVDPQDDDPRAKVGDKSSFPRFDAEVSFRTPLFDLKLEESSLLSGSSNVLSKLGVFYFSADYRYYQEIGASEKVKKADLDQYSYVALTIGTTSGVFFTYANGRVPFDKSDDNIFEIGYKFHF